MDHRAFIGTLTGSLLAAPLKRARPGDLPVEQPAKFATKALGLAIPPSLLQRADQVSE